jgi:hypothetical protein
MRAILGVVLLACVLLMTGCASVAHGGYQQVSVVSDPSGAAVVSDCGRGTKDAGETPVVVKVSRKAERCVITVRKAGYEDESVVLQRHMSGWIWGNLFLPYVTVPGVLVDLYGGAAYRRTPGSIDVRLAETRESATSASLSKDASTH